MRIPSNLLSNVTTIILSPQFLQNLLPSDNGHVHQDAPKWAKLSGQGDFNLLGVNPDRDGDARRMLVMIYDICKWRLFTNEYTDGDNMWSYLSRWWWRTRYWRRAWTTLALSMSSSELCTCLEDTVWSTCENVKGWVLHIPSSEKSDSPDGKNFFFELVLQRIGRKDLRPRPWKIILQRL